MVEILTGAGFDVAGPAVANFVYADTGTDARAVFDALLHEGVIVRPLNGFGSETAIRVTDRNRRGERLSRGRLSHSRLGAADDIVGPDLGRRLELLRRNRGFRLLFVATLGSLLGTWLATIALTVDVYDRTHSGTWVSALLIAVFLPTVARRRRGRAAARPAVAAAADDRVRPRCARASSSRCPFVDRPEWIVVLAAVSGLGNAIYPSGRQRRRCRTCSTRTSWSAATRSSRRWRTWRGRPARSSAARSSPSSGTTRAYWINAASFVFSAAVIRLIPARRLQSDGAISKGHWHDIADGLRVRAAVTGAAGDAHRVECGDDRGRVCQRRRGRASRRTRSTPAISGSGSCSAASGVGLAIGSFFGGMLAERRSVAQLYGPAMILAGIGYVLASVAPNVWVATPPVVVAGIGSGAAALYNVLLIQRGVPDSYRGRAFTLGDERDVRDPRPGDGRRGPGDERARCSLDLGDRRLLLDRGGLRRDRALAAPPLRVSRRRHEARAGRSRLALGGSSDSDGGNGCELGRERGAHTIRRMAKRREWTRESLAAGVRAGDKRALARAITLVENRDPLAYDVVRDIYPDTGRSLRRRRHGPARRRQVVADQRARPPRPRAASRASA